MLRSIIIIITLFQEENIFGTNINLYHMVIRYKDIHAFDNFKTIKNIYSMYRANKVSLHRAYCERATQPYFLAGGKYDSSRLKTRRCYHTRSLRMVTECDVN